MGLLPPINIITQVNAPVALNLNVLSGGPVAQMINQPLANLGAVNNGGFGGLGGGFPSFPALG